MQLIPSAPELGDDVFGKKLRVAAGDIYIHIGHAHEAVQNRLKFPQELHFVKENVVHSIIQQHPLDIGIEDFGVSEFLAFKGIKSNLYDMIRRNATLLQVLFEQRKQQVGFSAAAHTGNDLNQPIVLFRDQLI